MIDHDREPIVMARSDSPPEVMLGLLLLGTSFVTGFLVGWIVA